MGRAARFWFVMWLFTLTFQLTLRFAEKGWFGPALAAWLNQCVWGCN